MSRIQVLIGLLVIAILVGVGVYYVANAPSTAPVQETANQNAVPPSVKPSLEAAKYVGQNIGTLSPVKPAEGKTFSVKKTEISNATGTVYYTDGATDYVADFNFSVDGQNTTISDFRLRQ